MMDRNETKSFIATRAAMELRDGDVVNLGIGIPTRVAGHIPEGVHVTLHAENGIVGVGPRPVPAEEQPYYCVDAGGIPAKAVKGGCYIDSLTSFALARGGRLDLTILGTLEVDEEGSIANWIIPGVKVPGMGGAMDLLVGAKRVVIAMTHTTGKGGIKIRKQCTLPLTALRVAHRIITEMAVIDITPEGLMLMEYNPEYTLDQIQAVTEPKLLISPALRPMDQPWVESEGI
jgi:acetate CoA/acetoacetate CoA-transferase beta subunit